MGATYTVTAYLTPEDGQRLCDVMNRETVLNSFRALTSKTANYNKRGVLFADFTATYTWEQVMIEKFEEVIKDKESWVMIDNWDNNWTTHIDKEGAI